MVILYGLKTCDTCRRALREMAVDGLSVNFVDVRAEPVDSAHLRRWLEVFGDALVNRRSATWRGLDAEQQVLDPVALLRAHPAVMKRPVIAAGNRLWLGWGAQIRAELAAQADPR
jgi:arsenate reductase-like glutaredoxin family protein